MRHARRFKHARWLLPAVLCFAGHGLLAQSTTQPAVEGALVAMEFPAEGIELKTLVDIVTKRLHIPILYDESINGKRIVLRVPVNVPESSLLSVLQSAMRMKQMALIDADQPGWKQVVAAPNLAAVAKPTAIGAVPEPGMAITQVLTLRHTDPARLIEAIRPLLTIPGGNAQVLSGQRALIVSDYPTVMKRIAEMIALLDTEGAAAAVQFVPLKQAEATAIAPIATALITTKDTYQFGAAGTGILLSPDDRVNQLVVVAPADRMKEIVALIQGLDQPIDLPTKVYHFKSISPERIDKLMKNLLGGTAAKRSYQASVDRESQSLIVSASPEIHARLEAMTKELDIAVPESQSPIRFYKLKNTKAADVLSTISGLYGQSGNAGSANGLDFDQNPNDPRPANGPVPTNPAGVPPPVSSNGVNPPQPTGSAPALANIPANANFIPAQQSRSLTSLQRPSGDSASTGMGTKGDSRYGYNPSRAASGDLLGEGGNSGTAVHASNATVAADLNTNSIIVIAPPAVQIGYAELIKRLDQRRPQVQVECTIVTLDTSDGSSFAVDISKLGGVGASKLLTFSSFGVAGLNVSSGTLTPTAATGGTAALLNPGIADVVIRALSTHTRARLVSAPQLLVNDNGKGKLVSVNQQPFAEILDTASSQSRTGLGGQAEAGTTISIEPHISEDDYLQLAYSVELSSFTGTATAGLPPPSQKNTIDSTVTIPDGYTIVVGGLNQKNFTSVLNSLPIIDQIPIINLLFGSRSVQHTDTTLFVFIRPIILRNDKFDDLKYLSDLKTRSASLPGPYPVSEPIPIK